MHTIAHLLSLSLAATPLLIGFYLVYKLLLAGDARHRLNRLLLAIVPPLSFGAASQPFPPHIPTKSIQKVSL